MSYSVRNIVIALILAVVAAGLVIMYTSNVKSQADKSIKTTTVVVSKGDIVAGTPLNTLVSGGAFTTRQVATKDVVPGAFTSVSSLNTSLATDTNITAGAQITPAMFSSSKDSAIVNQIQGTMRAVQVAFNANRVLGGTLKAGDRVDIYGEMTIQATNNSSKISQETVAARIITNVEVLSTYDTGVASAPLTSASGANSASGTDDGTGGDAVILADPPERAGRPHAHPRDRSVLARPAARPRRPGHGLPGRHTVQRLRLWPDACSDQELPPDLHWSQPMTNQSPIKVFITGAANGLAEVREGLADHPDVELVGTAADPVKAGAKLAESAAQVILHGTTATEHVPTAEVEAIRAVTAAPIVLVTSASANSLLSEALQAGVHDVVLLPQLTDGIVFTIKKAHSLAAGRSGPSAGKAASHAEGKVVTIFSPKGGSGKTALACNLAILFARKHQRRTLLLDLDLQFGDVAIMMGIEPDKTIYDLVMARRELDSEALAGYVTAHQSGVHVLPAPLRPEDAELVTEERLGHLFAVAKESYDVVVVDTPPFFHGPVLSTLDRTDQLLLVTSMDVPAIKNVKLTLQTLDLLHYPKDRRHLLLNQTGSKVGLRKSEVERALDLKVAFEIPIDRDIPSSVNRGVPIALANPRASVVKTMGEIADALVPQRVEADAKKKRRGVR